MKHSFWEMEQPVKLRVTRTDCKKLGRSPSLASPHRKHTEVLECLVLHHWATTLLSRGSAAWQWVSFSPRRNYAPICCLSAGKCQSQTEILARKFHCFKISNKEYQWSGQQLIASLTTLPQAQVYCLPPQMMPKCHQSGHEHQEGCPGLQKKRISPPSPSNSPLNIPVCKVFLFAVSYIHIFWRLPGFVLI